MTKTKKKKTAAAAKPATKGKKAAAASKVVPPAGKQTKKAQALEMLRNGATLADLMQRFGWQPHTTRGFISIQGKTHKIESMKDETGMRIYRLVA